MSHLHLSTIVFDKGEKDSEYKSDSLESQILKLQKTIKNNTLKQKRWKYDLDYSIQTENILKTLEQQVKLKDDKNHPFWTSQSCNMSKKLWLPTSNYTSTSDLMGKSWFTIEKKQEIVDNKKFMDNSIISLVDSKIKETSKNKTNLKTVKIRLFPSEKEKEEIHLILDQFRWYYNMALHITNSKYSETQIKSNNHWSNYSLRDEMRKYDYREIHWKDGEKTEIEKQFIRDKERNEMTVPYWWKKLFHSRIPRGAVDKFISSLNSAVSNYKKGHIKNFKMSYKTSKDNEQYFHFEDSQFPSFLKDIKSHYWFTTKDRKRKSISFRDIFLHRKRGLELIYEKQTNRYFIHYPIEIDWFPENDKRIENQNMYVNKKERIISLDPGIRKFVVGYDPSGSTVFIGDKASLILTRELLDVDLIEDKKDKYKKWKYIKNLVSELQWKTVSYLIRNYDVIVLPEFKTSEMLKKKKLGPTTKRLMSMFSFYKFKEKLQWKCDLYDKKLVIVDESYTSCTCGVCGIQNNIKGKEEFNCNNCSLKIDRDINGARNILIKNIKPQR